MMEGQSLEELQGIDDTTLKDADARTLKDGSGGIYILQDSSLLKNVDIFSSVEQSHVELDGTIQMEALEGLATNTIETVEQGQIVQETDESKLVSSAHHMLTPVVLDQAEDEALNRNLAILLCGMQGVDNIDTNANSVNTTVQNHNDIHTFNGSDVVTVIPSIIVEDTYVVEDVTSAIQTRQNEGKLKCDKCSKQFHQISDLLSHYCRQRNVGKKNADKHGKNCGETPLRKRLLGGKNYKCHVCSRRFVKSSHLIAHRRIHSGERPFLCGFCEMRFSTGSALKRHVLVTHLDEKPHMCSYCGDKFASNMHLSVHVARRHTNNKPHGCEKCDKKYAKKDQLTEHMITHLPVKDYPFTCHICGKKNSMKRNHLRHLRCVHGAEPGDSPVTAPAPASTNSFAKPDALEAVIKPTKNHTIIKPPKDYAVIKTPKYNPNYSRPVPDQIDSDNKPYKCNICYRGFKKADNVRVHMRIHNREQPFKCQECASVFNTKSSLTRHMRTHSGEKPHACEVCDEHFCTTGQRDVHRKRKHTNDKPHTCMLCPKRFSAKSDLTSHLMVHSGDKPFFCFKCSKAFSRKYNFHRHEAVCNVQVG